MKEFIPDNITALFQPGGPMEKAVPGYHYRQEQVSLAREVADALVNNEFLVAEAGTGVGKTLAYLVPAICWAVLEGERVVIATRTRALQQQIMEKDIPAVQQMLPFNFEAAELKGRENYLCWNKYQSILGGRRSLEPDEVRFVETILTWAERTRTGDRMELQLPGHMMKHWPLLAADRYSCRKDICKYQDKCFRLKALRRCQKAHLVVTNHSLLLSDISVERRLLPEYGCLIIDEAHSFDREAFDKLSCGLNRWQVQRWFLGLYHRDITYERGYLQALRTRFPHLTELINQIRPLVEQGAKLGEALFDKLDLHVDFGSEYSQVITHAALASDWMADLFDLYLEWQASLHLLLKELEKLNQELQGEEEAGDIQAYILQLKDFSDKAFTIFEEDLQRDDRLIWLSISQGRVQELCSSLLEINNELDNGLYQHVSSLIMVSATLTVGESFDHIIRRCGLSRYQQEGRIRTLLERSPFHYEEQACLLMVDDMADPTREPEQFSYQVTEALLNIAETVKGRVMALFTSRKMLSEVSGLLRPLLKGSGIALLVQNEDGDFAALMDGFVNSEKALLMGLETYWEGVDLKGDLLKCLVVVKLPFRSPSDPYASAAEKYCRLHRLNTFNYFMLPDAAVRFKQGIGRLIRSEDDRGVAIVLDSRITRQPYGKVFQNSSPISNQVIISRKEIAQQVERWT
ncbi:MAG TPA: helicase C-terminal domain-containing protein [Syntrophomonadaceae bacterium]|nr:DEAD/DEAH box helicase [Syntrophomonadaceae bacterium]HOQ10353.1 helicase C-terminal domain-containing protein [Syntrophomonadaceae bacterium]HPU49511.1 helicase C-terminal domain-containing protein [Syntrophomonadaceae bacterium]